jgi:hypothetical protein
MEFLSTIPIWVYLLISVGCALVTMFSVHLPVKGQKIAGWSGVCMVLVGCILAAPYIFFPKSDLTLISPDSHTSETISYVVQEVEGISKNNKTVYKTFYLVGVKNTSPTHKTLEGVNLKSLVDLPIIADGVQQKNEEPMQLQIYGQNGIAETDLDPNETAYFQIAHSFSNTPIFSPKFKLMGTVVELSGDEFRDISYNAEKGGTFIFEQNQKTAGTVKLTMQFDLGRETPFGLKPSGIFIASAKNTEPQYMRLTLLHDKNNTVVFKMKKIRKTNE